MAELPAMTERTKTVLACMLDQPDREWYTSDLAEVTGIPIGTIPSVLPRLLARKWVKDKPDPGHQVRRSYTLTKKGIAEGPAAVGSVHVNGHATPAPAPEPEREPVLAATFTRPPDSHTAWIRHATRVAFHPEDDPPPVTMAYLRETEGPAFVAAVQRKLAEVDPRYAASLDR